MLKHLALIVLLSLFAPGIKAIGHSLNDSNLPPDVLHYLLYTEPVLHLHTLGNVSDLDGTLKRTFLQPGHRRAAKILQRWMVEAGMLSWLDAVGNVRGRTASSRSGPALMIGSHYDTVIDGGIYDGALGVVVGISAIKAALLDAAVAADIITPKELSEMVYNTTDPDGTGRLDLRVLLSQAAPVLKRTIEVAAFSDEEGVRFQSTFLGSLALVGQIAEKGLLSAMDANGITLKEALEEAGMDTSPAGFRATSLHPGEVDGYIEVHIEQGPVLQAVGQPLGPVSAIAGQTRLLASLIGSQGHAGTVPMKLRKDPLAAAAELIAELERICGGGSHAGPPFNEDLAKDDSLVCTVGSISLWPNASNVIPARTNFTIDIRSRSNDRRYTAVSSFEDYMTAMCQRRGIQCILDKRHEADAVECDPLMVDALSKAVETSQPMIQRVLSLEREYKQAAAAADIQGSCQAEKCDGDFVANTKPTTTHGTIGDAPVLVSGAGHDAMVMANITRMGMLFVRCKDGISHSPEEHVEADDVAAAVAALYQYIRQWVNE